jgi:sugar (pentulose or hexulose) kinase
MSGAQDRAPPRIVAVVDTGKTNAKVVLVDAESGAELALRSTRSAVRQDGPYAHFDVARSWQFICDALAELNHEAPIEAISLIAHGSAGALLSGSDEGDGLALPILDYEFTGPDELASDYNAVRPGFSETFSPRLPAGLNLGAQIFWQQRRFPEAFASPATYVTYPQYWAWRLSGVAATEMCSIGAHSDLWDPRKLAWSSLVGRMGWDRLMAPLRSAFDRLGPVRPDLAQSLGLHPATPVICGLHDSSASLLPHLKERTPPFTIVSTGTWVILFAVGGDIGRLDPKRDTLANVSVFGDPVPCARFMGGREFEFLTRGDAREPSPTDLDRVLAGRIVALPSFAPGVGPFPLAKGAWTTDPDTLSAGERTAAASLYLAFVTAESMAAAGASGTVVIEGPFAANRLYCAALSALTGLPVCSSNAGTGTTAGAVLLATGTPAKRPSPSPVAPLAHPALAAYAEEWRRVAGASFAPPELAPANGAG